ncbi:hypothetical protein ACFL2X_04940 [Candidatus Latescibacterota bacterium]
MSEGIVFGPGCPFFASFLWANKEMKGLRSFFKSEGEMVLFFICRDHQNNLPKLFVIVEYLQQLYYISKKFRKKLPTIKC